MFTTVQTTNRMISSFTTTSSASSTSSQARFYYRNNGLPLTLPLTKTRKSSIIARDADNQKKSNSNNNNIVSINDDDDEEDDDDFLQFLEDSMEVASGAKKDDDWIGLPGTDMTGEELRKLVLKRYGKLYDTRICQRRDSMNKLQMFLQIMWKFVGQKSFPMTEAEYIEQTNAVAEILTTKNRQDLVRQSLPRWPKWPKMDTTGANAVMIPLDVDEEDLTINGE